MSLLLAVALLAQQPPVVEFPQPGLDDSAAYEGYTTRVYRDARGNTVQIYLDRKHGRVVHLWADALNESIGFTAVGEGAVGGAAVAFAAREATVGATGGQGGRRWLRYSLTAPGGRALHLTHFLLGSMRVERDFQYAGSYVPTEFNTLIANLARLPPESRQRRIALAALGAPNVATLRARLAPRITVEQTATTWLVRVTQPSFDGRNHLTLILRGDPRQASVTAGRDTVTIRRRVQGSIELDIEISTDGPALTPLTREQIFNDAFRRFAAARASDARLEREIRGFELLSSREKLMAGLPTFATYFGRDMLMTALLMEPVWSDTMPEYVIAAALKKLGPAGDVSHEEAVGGQAIRENVAEYNHTGSLRALAHPQTVRENYFMVDDDFQLPVVAARYFANAAVPAERKHHFVTAYGRLLARNLAHVWRRAAPYARAPVATNLVGFQRDPDGWWHPGSWRDSRVGYAGGRFAFDVNAVWVPAALRAIAVMRPWLDSTAGLPDSATLDGAIDTWGGAIERFEVALAPAEVATRVRAKVASLPAAERAHWDSVLAGSGFPADTLRFLAVSLDGEGRPIPVMSTDPAMLLLLEDLPPAREA
ncbi:MAG TPA: hypothetical protein VGJ83_05285, partial [Gemmatimonadales bacterium]